MATKIFVDAGHGGTNPGAVGNGVIEGGRSWNRPRFRAGQ